jgi:hydroxycarboxylate dehydrogenase B
MAAARAIKPSPLTLLASRIMQAAGCNTAEAEAVGRLLVTANLVGHDSHGVIRVAQYVTQLKSGDIRANQHATEIFANDALTLFEGNFGFGQVVGHEATTRGIALAKTRGIAMVGLRNAGHVGRLGDWAELAAAAGIISMHFVNTQKSPWVAPFGGMGRRLSTNPICVGVPRAGDTPVILDMTTSVVAEGKVRVARNKGAEVPEGWIVDKSGKPTRNPSDLYDGGSMLAIAGHKGSGLSIIVELFAGCLTGGGGNDPKAPRQCNNMLSIFIAPSVYAGACPIDGEIKRFIDWVKSSPPASPGGAVMVPGEMERRLRAEREANGIPLDDQTIGQILDTGAALGLAKPELQAMIA